MSKKNSLADAVQRYFWEVIDSGGYSGKQREEILDEMRVALYAENPKAQEGPPQPPPIPMAESIPEESKDVK